jgi:hypothetical protein
MLLLLLLINCALLFFIFFQCNVVKEGNDEEDGEIRKLDILSRIKGNEHALVKIGQDIDDLNRNII